MDALFHGVVYLLAACGHVGLLAAVDDGDLAAQTQCGTCGIHRHIAAADHCHTATKIDGRVVPLVVTVHEIGAGEELVGGEDTAQRLAWNAHEFGQAGTAGDVYGLEPVAVEKVVYRQALAHNDVGLDFYTQTAQVVDFGFYHLLFGQTELGDAVNEHTSCMVEGFEDGDTVAFLGQVAGTGQSRGAGTDDGHFLLVSILGDFRAF